jgi:hypothetical protein
MIFFFFEKNEEEILKKIIYTLDISDSEKELYCISLEILDDKEFTLFFEKIINQVNNTEYSRIAPLTSNLL